MENTDRFLLQNIVRCYKNQLLSKPLPLKHIKAIEAIDGCRSGARGMSAYECEEHQHTHLIAHSCRHRSCSLCSLRSRTLWVNEQKKRLLDCPHFHCVFTLPEEYRVLWQYNQKWFVSTFFDVVRSCLMDMMKDESKHAVTPGVLMAMHTWGRKMNLHPHIHCIVTGGGLDSKGHWKDTGKYLLPCRQIRALYRGRFQARIKDAFKADELTLPPDHDGNKFWKAYKTAYSKTWCIHIEDQYAHGRGVLLYLSRYLRGGPIHPSQLVRCDNERIGFHYKDHQDKTVKLLELKPREFIRRLLLHVPESGQHMVRHYGLYAGAAKRKRNVCREAIGGLLENMKDRDEVCKKESIKCRCCGARMTLKWALFPRRSKGNSYKVELPTEWYVQQVDEADIGQGKKKVIAQRL